MRVHHLNCISTCPLGGKLMDGRSTSLRAKLVLHCLLLELDDQLVLVDTGLGLRDVADPYSRLSKFFLALMRPDFRAEMTAVRQIEAMGFDPHDVRHIVLTHLDFDHAGGLDDFPWATVHMLLDERDSATAQRTLLDRMRYRPQQWSTRPRWRVYGRGEGDPWFGFDAVRSLEGVPPEILMVPLLGHTLGHAGVAIDRGEGWLLQCGDAYFHHRELDLERPWCTPGLRFYQWMMEKDRKARLWNQQRLRELKATRGKEVAVVCGHDPLEFVRVAGRPIDVPALRPEGPDLYVVGQGGNMQKNKEGREGTAEGRAAKGKRRGQAVEPVPTGVAERQAARVAGRTPLDARTKQPMANPDEGRMERPDAGYRGDDADRDQLANSADKQPHDHES
jgi:glyoxylase-like metal-dependent hydrolase (beta-lactamase superfamily II)